MSYEYDTFADDFSVIPARRRRRGRAVTDDPCRGLSYQQCRRGPRCGRGNQGVCSWRGIALGCRCGGDDVIFPPPQTRAQARLFVDAFDDEELDALIDAAIRPPSPWPRLLRQTQAAIRRALEAYRAGNLQAMTSAIRQANSALLQAHREVTRVMSGQRATRVVAMLSNAYWSLASAHTAAATGQSIYGRGRSLLGVDTHLGAALSAVQAAVQAVGLQGL